MEKQIEKLMKNLDITREEALQIIEDDKAIDKGEKLFEFTAEQKAMSKKARSIGMTAEKPKAKREKKTDNDKHELFEILKNAVCGVAEDLEILNDDRELLIHYNGRKFKIVLSAPRK